MQSNGSWSRFFVETQDLLELSSIHAFVVLVLVLIQELFVNRFQWKNLFKTELSEDARQMMKLYFVAQEDVTEQVEHRDVKYVKYVQYILSKI